MRLHYGDCVSHVSERTFQRDDVPSPVVNPDAHLFIGQVGWVRENVTKTTGKLAPRIDRAAAIAVRHGTKSTDHRRFVILENVVIWNKTVLVPAFNLGWIVCRAATGIRESSVAE